MATNKDDKPKLPKPKRSYKSAVDKLRNSKKGFGDLKQAEYEESQLPEKLKEQNEQRFLEDIYMPTVTKFVPTDVGEGVTTNPVQRLTEIIRRRQTEEKKESDPSRKVSTEEFIQQNTDYVRPSTTENLPSFNGKREGETVEGRFIPIDLLEKSLGFSYDKIKNNSIVRETLAKYKDLPLKEALSNTKQELSQELSKKVPTITEDPLHYGKKFADGFSQMFISGLKSVAAITNLSATSTGFDIKDSPVYQAAQYLQKKKDEIFTDNKYQQTFSTDLATGIGSMTSFLLPSGIAAKVGLNPTVTSAILGGLFNSGDAFQEAYEKTGDLKKAYISLTANFGLGLTESLPIANMLGRLGKLTGRNVSRDLAAGLFAGYLTEGTQEFGQQFGSEVIGKLLGVHDRSVGEMFGNSIYAGSLGGIIGSSMNIAGIGGKYGLSSLRTTGLTKKLSNADLTKMQDLHGLLSNIEKDFATLTKKDQEGIIRALSNKSVGYNLINLTEGKEGTSVTLEDLDETKGLSEDEETRYSINIPLIKTLAERLKNENKKSDTGQTDIDKRGTDTKTVQGEEGKEIKQGDNKELPKSDKPNGLQQPKEDQGTDSERGFLEQEFKEKSERLKQLYTAQQETEDPVELESIKKESETLISELENIQNELNTVPETEVTPESPKESVPETKEEKQPEKKEEKNYSSTQVNIPENQTGQFKEFSESIPEEDIYSEEGYGRETEPHITALYGLHTADPNKVKEILEDSGEIEAELGETKVFENDDYDVLVVEVKSDGLNKINKTLSDNLEYTNSYDGYKPHLTIAYLKKGTGKKYAGNKKFAGQKFNFRELLFSDKLRNKFPITLKKDVSKKSISEQPEKKISKYQQDRIQGFKTINGKRYDRQEVIDDIEVGKETEINFTKDVKVKGHYALIPAEKLQSSHDIDGKQNPKHFIPEAQPRNRSALEVLKSEPKKKGENLDPKQVGLSNTAYTGSPIVNERGELIQGTGRSQALNYYFEKFEGDPKQYYEHLKEISSLTGLSEKAIDDMIELYGNVALVRVVNATDEAAIKLGNYKSSEMEDVTGSITGIDKAAVNRLSAEELDEFVKLMTKNLEADAGISLKDIIRQGGRDILNNLIKIGAIREDEIALYLNNLGTITNVGTDNIYNFFKELLFRGGEADLSEYFENLPHQTKAGLEKSIVLIVGLPEEKSLILEVQNAIIGYTQYLSAEENQPLLTLKDWLETPSMFGEANEDIYSPAEQLIMKTLNKPKRQKDISDFFANYYNLVKDKPADLFNPEIQKGLSKEEVFNNILNDNGQKPKTSSKPDKKKESKPEQEPKDNAGSETDVDEKGTGKEVRKKFSDYPELQSDLEIPKRIKAINDIAEKYGWRTETSEDFVDLYNRNDKKVATVKIKYDKKVGTYRFNITDSGGSKVRDIRAVTLEDLDRSLNNSLQEDFYAQLLPEQSKKSTGKETFESDAEKLKKQSDDIDNDLNDFPFQKKKTLENIGDLTIRLEQQEKRKADVEKKIEETKKLGKGEITKRVDNTGEVISLFGDVEFQGSLGLTHETDSNKQKLIRLYEELTILNKSIAETKKDINSLTPATADESQESLFQKEQEVFNSLTEQLKGLLGSVQQIKKSFPNIDIILTDSAGVKRKLLQAGNELAKQKDFKSPLGFVSRKEGKVYINSEKADMTTPIHEVAGHIFMMIIKETNPSLYKTGLKLAFQNKKTLEYVKNEYPELVTEGVNDEDNIKLLDEVLAQTVGSDVKDIFADVKDAEIRQGLIERFKEWLAKVINNMKLRFAKQYEDQPEIVNKINSLSENSTIEDWVKAFESDIKEGNVISEVSSKKVAKGKPEVSQQKDAEQSPEKVSKATDIIAKFIKIGIHKIDDIATEITDRGGEAMLPYIQVAYKNYKDNYNYSIAIQNSLNDDEEINKFDFRDYGSERTKEQTAIEEERILGGYSDYYAIGGTPYRRRPSLRYSDEANLPEVKKEYVVKEQYGKELDEHQRYAVNLAINNYLNGKKSFLLGDGTGVGKTREILALAEAYTKHINPDKPVLIITKNKTVINQRFIPDAEKLGIDPKKYQYYTYADLSAGKIPSLDYGLVAFDEAHNLKNSHSYKFRKAQEITADHKLYPTATPMDRVVSAAYFLSEVTGINKQEIYNRLRISEETATDSKGEEYPLIVLNEGVTINDVIDNLIEIRNEAIQNGAMIRRTYAFYGKVNPSNLQPSGKFNREQDYIANYYNKKIENAWYIKGLSKSEKIEIKKKLGLKKRNELLHLTELEKVDHVVSEALKDLADGRQVILIANNVNPKTLDSLIGTEFDPQRAGTIQELVKRFEKAGYKVSKMYGTGKHKLDGINKFQSGENKVIIGTYKSMSEGIELDDTVGNSPRVMYDMSPSESGDQFEQVVGRVSRRNTVTPAWVKQMYVNLAITDVRRRQINEEKMRILHAVQEGKDADLTSILAGYNSANQDEENFVFQKDKKNSIDKKTENNDNQLNLFNYETQTGEKISYEATSLLSGNKGTDNSSTGKGRTANNPALRQLQDGEIARSEIKYSTYKNLKFYGRNTTVESYEDVAFLMKQLENQSIEHFFVVHVLQNGKPIIQHLTTGTATASLVHPNYILDFVEKLGTKELYMIHNHPSGEVDPSNDDLTITKRFAEVFNTFTDKEKVILKGHIIMNLKDGKYTYMDIKDSDIKDIKTMPSTVGEMKSRAKVFTFNRQVFKKDVKLYKDEAVSSPEMIAKYLSGARFSSGEKFQTLILDQRNKLIARLNIQNLPTKDPKSFREELAVYTARFGALQYILVGNVDTGEMLPIINQLQKDSRNLGVQLLDYVFVHSIRQDNKKFEIDSAKKDLLMDKSENYAFQKDTKELTEEEKKANFDKWFEGSKVVDNNGEPLEVYHATTQDFTVFDIDKANPKGHYGRAFYFTDSETDADENYQGDGADLKSRIEFLAERIEANEGISSKRALAKATKQLKGKSDKTMSFYLSMKYPADLTDEGDYIFEPLGYYDEETDEFIKNEDSEPYRLYDIIQEIQHEFEGLYATDLWNDISTQLGYFSEPISLKQLDIALRNSNELLDVSDYEGNLISYEVIRRIYEELGFDGIIMDADKRFGSKSGRATPMNMDYDTKHYIVFKPTQIKSSTDNSGEYGIDQPDFLMQKETKSIDDINSKQFKNKLDKAGLIAIHNLSEEKLISTDKMGGLAMPSIAITKADQGFTNFGNISLIADKELIDPTRSSTKVYPADAYSPRYPQVHYKVRWSKVENAYKDLPKDRYEGGDMVNRVHYDIEDRGLESFIRSSANLVKFRNEFNLPVKDVEIVPSISKTVVNKIKKIEGVTKHSVPVEIARLPEFQKIAREYWEKEYKGLHKEIFEKDKFDKELTSDDYHVGNLLMSLARDVQYAIKTEGKYDLGRTTSEIENYIHDNKLREKYLDYVQNIYDDLGVDESIYGKPYSSENNRLVDHTLENVVRRMKKEKGEGFFYGAGSVRAGIVPTFRTLHDIKSQNYKIIPKEEFDNLKDEIENELSDVVNLLSKYYKYDSSGFGYSKETAEELIDFYRRGSMPSFENISDEDKETISEFLVKLKNLPSEYFEAKLHRAVDLSEFKAALVPENIDKKALAVLNKAGLDVRYYSDTDEKRSRREMQNTEFEDYVFQKDTKKGYKELKNLLDKNASVDEINKLINDFEFILYLNDDVDIPKEYVQKLIDLDGIKFNTTGARIKFPDNITFNKTIDFNGAGDIEFGIDTVFKVKQSFANQGSVTIHGTESLPEQTKFSNLGRVVIFDIKNVSGVYFDNSLDIHITGSSTLLGGSNIFQNGGDITLKDVTVLPDNTVFQNDGNVFLNDIESNGENVRFHNKEGVYINEINMIHADTDFHNEGIVSIRQVDVIEHNVKFDNMGSITIGIINNIGKGVIFNNPSKSTVNIALDEIQPDLTFKEGQNLILRKIKEVPFMVTSMFRDISFPDAKTIDPLLKFITNNGQLHLPEIKKLPKGFKINIAGDFLANKVEKISDDVTIISESTYMDNAKETGNNVSFNIRRILDSYRLEKLGNNNTFEGRLNNLIFEKLTNVPKSTKFFHEGDIVFRQNVIDIEEGTVFKNKGSVRFTNLKKLGGEIRFLNDRDVEFHELQSMGENIQFMNMGNLTILSSELNPLKELPKGTYLGSNEQISVPIEEIKEGIFLGVSKRLFLPNLKHLPEDHNFWKPYKELYFGGLEDIPEGYTFANNGHVHIVLPKAKTKNISFYNKGDVKLIERLHFRPNDNHYLNEYYFNNEGYVTITAKKVKFTGKPTIFKNKGTVHIPNLINTLSNVEFYNDIDVLLANAETIGEGVEFYNNEDVIMPSMKKLPENQVFNNRKAVSMMNINKISKGVQFQNKGSVDLPKVKEMDTVKFNSEGHEHINLSSYTLDMLKSPMPEARGQLRLYRVIATQPVKISPPMMFSGEKLEIGAMYITGSDDTALLCTKTDINILELVINEKAEFHISTTGAINISNVSIERTPTVEDPTFVKRYSEKNPIPVQLIARYFSLHKGFNANNINIAGWEKVVNNTPISKTEAILSGAEKVSKTFRHSYVKVPKDPIGYHLDTSGTPYRYEFFADTNEFPIEIYNKFKLHEVKLYKNQKYLGWLGGRTDYDEGIMYVTEIQSDLLQRTNELSDKYLDDNGYAKDHPFREWTKLRSKIENHFKGWYYIFANSSFQNALKDKRIKEIWLPTQEFYTSHVSGAKNISEIYEKISELYNYEMSADGNWRVIKDFSPKDSGSKKEYYEVYVKTYVKTFVDQMKISEQGLASDRELAHDSLMFIIEDKGLKGYFDTEAGKKHLDDIVKYIEETYSDETPSQDVPDSSDEGGILVDPEGNEIEDDFEDNDIFPPADNTVDNLIKDQQSESDNTVSNLIDSQKINVPEIEELNTDFLLDELNKAKERKDFKYVEAVKLMLDDIQFQNDKKIIKDKLKGNNDLSFLGLSKLNAIDKDFVKAVIRAGKYLYNNVSKKFREWSMDMANALGQWVEKHLPVIFENVESKPEYNFEKPKENIADPNSDIEFYMQKDSHSNDKSIEDALKKFGIPIPQKTTISGILPSGKEKVRKFTLSVGKHPEIEKEIKQEVKNSDWRFYNQIPNAQTIQEAINWIENTSEDEVLSHLYNDQSEIPPRIRNAAGIILARAYDKDGAAAMKSGDKETASVYFEKSIQILKALSQEGTRQGQGVQAFAILGKWSPEQWLYQTAKGLSRSQAEFIDEADKRKKLIEHLINRLNIKTVEGLDQFINEQVESALEKEQRDIDISSPDIKDLPEAKLPEDLENEIDVMLSEIDDKDIIKAIKRLAGRIAVYPKDFDPINYMVNTLYKIAVENDLVPAEIKRKAQDKIPMIELIGNAVKNKEQFTEVWDKAKKLVQQRYGKDEKALKELNQYFSHFLQEPFSKSQVISVTGKAIKELEIKINEIVKKHYSIQERKKKELVDKLIDEAGLTREQAMQLSKAIEQRFDEITTEAKHKILEKTLKNPLKILGKKNKELYEKIIELSNLGALSDEEYTKLFAERFEIKSLNPDQAAEIVKKAEAIELQHEGFKKNELIVDMLNYIQKVNGIKISDAHMGLWYASILSGVSTHQKNILFNLFNLVIETMNRNPAELQYVIPAMLKAGLDKGILEGWDIMKKGLYHYEDSKYFASNVLELYEFKGGNANPMNYAKYVGRSLTAEDRVFYHMFNESESSGMAYSIAKSEGLSGKDLQVRMSELLGNSEDQIALAKEQAKDEGYTGIEYKRRVYELIVRGRDTEIFEQAKRYAMRGTLNYTPKGVVGALTRGIESITHNKYLKPTKFIIPFTRILANLTNNLLDFSPVGYYRAVKGDDFGVKGLEGREFTREINRATFGTLLAATLGIWISTLDDDEDNYFDITGNGFNNYDKNKQLEPLGWKPFTVKIGVKRFNFLNTPIAVPLVVLGSIRDMYKYETALSEAALHLKMSALLTQFATTMTNFSFISGLIDFMGIFDRNKPNKAEQYFTKLGAGIVGAAVPNFLKQFGIFHDDTMYDVDTFTEMVIRNWGVGGLYGLNPRVNVLGEVIKRDNPFIPAEVKRDKAWELIIKHKAFISGVDESTPIYDQVNGEDRIITPDEHFKLVKESGDIIKQTILDNYEDLSKENPEVIRDQIDKITDFARKKIKEEISTGIESEGKFPYKKKEVEIKINDIFRDSGLRTGSNTPYTYKLTDDEEKISKVNLARITKLFSNRLEKLQEEINDTPKGKKRESLEKIYNVEIKKHREAFTKIKKEIESYSGD